MARRVKVVQPDPWAPLLEKTGGDLDAALAAIKEEHRAKQDAFLATIPESSKSQAIPGSAWD